MKFTIDIKHRYTDNDKEENEYRVIFPGEDSSAYYENTFDDMRAATDWIGMVIRDTLVDYGKF